MKRILISAYACEPGRGSEPAVGWNTAIGLAEYYEIWVLTRLNNKEKIEKELKEKPRSNLHFIYYDLPKWLCFWKRGGKGVQLYYYLWQIGIYKFVKELTRKIKFDAIHHVTFVNYYKPSFLALLPIPFIWGPVGGGETAPKSLWKSLKLHGMLYEAIRETARWLSERDPWVRITGKKSILTFATSEETANRLKKLGVNNIKILSQVSLTDDDFEILTAPCKSSNHTFRFISIGRLVSLKGFQYGIIAFSKSNCIDAEYWIIGDGPERKSLELLTKTLGISHRVRFFGQLSRKEALLQLKDSDVLIHPSLHESGGWVIAEAMACKKPIVYLNIGGPHAMITESVGFGIECTNEGIMITEICKAMNELGNNRSLYLEKSRQSYKLSRKIFSISKRTNEIVKNYEEFIF